MPNYRVKLHNPQHGAVGVYLSCHGSVGTDNRSGDSSFVHVNVAHHGDVWSLEPIKGKPCTYQIRLANQGNGARGTYLSAHRSVNGDTRSGNSSYVNANNRNYGEEWTLVPKLDIGRNAFRVHLTKPKGSVVGSVLCAHNTVSGAVLSDKRGNDSTYVHVNEDMDNSYWIFEDA